MNIGFDILTVLAYFVAQFVVIWMLATNAINSKLNGVNTFRQYLKCHAAGFVWMALVGLSVMALYADFRVPVCSWLAGTWPSYLGWIGKYPIPVTPATSLAWGLFANPILHIGFGVLARKWPVFGFLSPELPPGQPPPQPPAK